MNNTIYQSFTRAYGFTDQSTNVQRYKTVMNTLGYIPGVAKISGLARLAFAGMDYYHSKNQKDKTFYSSMMARGFIEFVGLGTFLLIPDLLKTEKVNNFINKILENNK